MYLLLTNVDNVNYFIGTEKWSFKYVKIDGTIKIIKEIVPYAILC